MLCFCWFIEVFFVVCFGGFHVVFFKRFLNAFVVFLRFFHCGRSLENNKSGP